MYIPPMDDKTDNDKREQNARLQAAILLEISESAKFARGKTRGARGE